MPISPTVNAYMAQDQGQQEAPQDQDTLFKKSFSDHAFNSLRAKAPAIIPYVTTFRTFDYDIDNGDAFGTFILSYGSELVFVPIVMSSGSISSCEMVYIRSEDRFVPLSDDFIKKIVNENSSTMAKPFKGPVKVEDTRNMFRNLIRPPMSSNVVFASGRMDISELPNEAKAQVASYFRDHPDLLRKIAEFYPIEVLAERLSEKQEKTASTFDDTVPMLIKLAETSPDEIAYLGQFDRETLLRRGWLLKNAESEPKISASPEDFGHEAIVRMSEHGGGDATMREIRSGKVVRFTNGRFEKNDALIMGDDCGRCWCTDGDRQCDSMRVILGDGRNFIRTGRLVIEDSKAADEDDLKQFGFVPIGEIRSQLTGNYGTCLVAVPRKHGGWSLAKTFHLYSGSDNFSVVSQDGSTVIRDGSNPIVESTDAIKFGSIRGSVVPKNALFKVVKENVGESVPGLINTLQHLFDILRSNSIVLRVANSSGVTEITDTTTQKTASFASQGDAAKWLNSEYGLSERQIVDTLNRPETMVMTKFADGYMANQPMGLQPAPQQQMPMQQPQLNPQGSTTVQVPQMPSQGFNPNSMEAFVGTGDPEMVDVGILSSFAGNQDVKTLLVDYMPDFVSILDRIGRIILLFCIQRRELEQYYRVDKINELLQNCRKVFKIIGDLVQSLQVYINMA